MIEVSKRKLQQLVSTTSKKDREELLFNILSKQTAKAIKKPAKKKVGIKTQILEYMSQYRKGTRIGIEEVAEALNLTRSSAGDNLWRLWKNGVIEWESTGVYYRF